MNKKHFIVAGIAVLAILFVGSGYAHAFNLLDLFNRNLGANSTVNALNPWKIVGTEITPRNDTLGLAVPSLVSCNTIDTDADGIFSCGTDEGGVGSNWATTSSDYWAQNDLKLSEISDVEDGNAWGQLLMWTGSVWSTTSTSSLGIVGAADGNWSTTSADYWETQQTARTADDLSDNTTSDLAEGSNLYFTWARATTSFNNLFTATTTGWDTDASDDWSTTSSDYWETQQTARTADDLSNNTTSDLSEGTNLYWTSARATSAVSALIAATTTTAIGEGSNLYYTDLRVGDYITASTTMCEMLTGAPDLCDGNDATGGTGYFAKTGTTLYPAAGETVGAPNFTGTSTATSSFKNLAGVMDASQFSGADIGAQINAAYAALPATGGDIYVPAGSYSFSTEIDITTNSKPARIICPAGGATRLTYTGTTGTSTTFNVDWGDVPANQEWNLGIQGCWFYGEDNTYANVGLEVGGTQGGQGFKMVDTRWYTFGTGMYLGDNVYVNTFEGNHWNWSGTNIRFKDQPSNSGESIWFENNLFEGYGTFAADCVDTGSYWTTVMFTNNSFDDCGVRVGAYSEVMTFTGNHFETPGLDSTETYSFLTIDASTGGEANVYANNNLFFQSKNTTRPGAYIDNNGATLIAENNAALTLGASSNYTLDNFVDCEVSGAYCKLRNNSLSQYSVVNVIDDGWAQSSAHYFGWDNIQVKDGGNDFGWNQNTTGDFMWYWNGTAVGTSSSDGDWTFTVGTTTVKDLAINTNLSFGGVVGSAWTAFCEAITQGVGLCDGVDNTGGGSGLATSTAIADTWIIYGTSPSDVGAEAAFTYDDATDKLTVVNASTTNLSATSFWLGSGAATGILSSLGNYDLTLQTGNPTTGNITITDGANGNITIAPNGTGVLKVGSGVATGYIQANGSADTVLRSGGEQSSLTISTGVNGNITATPDGTGQFIVSGASTTLASTTINGNLAFGGVTGNAWSTFCESITGHADLCDGNDATGNSTVYLATTSPWTVGQLGWVVNDGTVSSVATGTLTESVAGLQFDNTRALVGGSAALSLTSGYEIPTTASTSEWTTAYTWGDHSLQNYITLASLSATSPIQYNSGTGAFTWAGVSTSTALADTQLVYGTAVGTIGSEAALTYDDALDTLTVVNASTTDLSVATGIELFGGGQKTTANALCIQLTGHADLCDGIDNTSGGTGLSTSTEIADTYVIYGTSPSTVGAEAAFVYDDALDKLTVVNASTTYLTATNVFGNLVGNADTATALTANAANCTSGQFAAGVDASGAAEDCADVWTEAENTAAAYIALTDLSATYPINYNSGTGAFTWNGLSTSTNPTSGNLSYWTGLSTLGTVATGTLTENVTGLEFSATGNLVGSAAVLNLTAGYGIPLTASTTNWNNFYDTPSTRITDGNGLTWSGNTLNFDGGDAPAGELGGTWASPTIDDSLAVTNWNLTTPTFTTSFTFDSVTVNNLSGIDTNIITGTAGSNGHCAQWDSNGDLITTGAACGGSGTTYLASTTPWTVGQLGWVVDNGTLSSVATGTLTENVAGLEFSATGNLVGSAAVLNLSTGYGIPLTASTTEWYNFNLTPSTRITDGNGLTWSGNTLNFDGGDAPAGELGGTWSSPTIDDSLAVTNWNLTTPTFTTSFVFDGVTVNNLSGIDQNILTGTVANTNALLTVDANDDVVEYSNLTWNITAATCTGDGNGGALTIVGTEIVCSADAGGGGSGDPGWATSTAGSDVVLYPVDPMYDVIFGRTSTPTAPFWWDVSATTSYIGNGGAGDSFMKFAIDSVDKWVLGADDSDSDAYVISSGGTLGTNNVWRATATQINHVVQTVFQAVITLFADTNPTIDAAGEMALDTTDDQLVIGDSGGTARVFATDEFRILNVTVASTSQAFTAAGNLPVGSHKDGLEITQFRCYVISGTSYSITLTDGTNATESITCATTVTSDTDVTTNDTFTADEIMYLDFGTKTGTVDYVHFEAYARITRE